MIKRTDLIFLFALIITLLNITLSHSASATDLSKISPSLKTILNHASPTEKIIVWVYLNKKEGKLDNSFMTEKSKIRRAKVDKINFLIDEKDIPISQSAITAIKSSGASIRHQSRWFNAVSVEADRLTLETISSLSFVKKIEILKKFSRKIHPKEQFEQKLKKPVRDNNLVLALDYGPSLLQNQFVKSTKLHLAGLSGQGILIAIFDSGFKTTHPAFDSLNLFATYDFINKIIPVDSLDCSAQPFIFQQNFHGTAVLGAMAGNVPGELIGPAYKATYALAKTEITCDGIEIKVEEDNWIAAAEWADSIGADIISSSLGYYLFQDAADYVMGELDGNTALITQAADIAASKNILVINSAGNERQTDWGTIIFPADADSVIAVGAVLSDSSLTSFSSPGPSADGRIKPEIVTLGSNVYTADFQGGYKTYSGTSFSAPLVSASAALAFEHDPNMTAVEYRNLIKATASQAQTPDNDFGYGLFDAALAADIIKINKSGDFILFLNETLQIHIKTSGRTSEIPLLRGINLPANSRLVDSGNGNGLLILSGTKLNNNRVDFILTAGLSYYTDSTNFTLETYAAVLQSVIAAPNPFTESVSFLISSSAGDLKSISIFNIAGEKIWEKVNISALFAEETIVWDGRNESGERVSSGVYLVFIRAENYEGNVKLLKIE